MVAAVFVLLILFGLVKDAMESEQGTEIRGARIVVEWSRGYKDKVLLIHYQLFIRHNLLSYTHDTGLALLTTSCWIMVVCCCRVIADLMTNVMITMAEEETEIVVCLFYALESNLPFC